MMRSMTNNDRITMREVAAVFGVEHATVARWVQMHRLPSAGRFGDGLRAPLMFDPVIIKAWGRELVKLAEARL